MIIECQDLCYPLVTGWRDVRPVTRVMYKSVFSNMPFIPELKLCIGTTQKFLWGAIVGCSQCGCVPGEDTNWLWPKHKVSVDLSSVVMYIFQASYCSSSILFC